MNHLENALSYLRAKPFDMADFEARAIISTLLHADAVKRLCVDCGVPADLMTLGGHDLCRPCNKARWEASIAIPSDPFATAEPCWKGGR